ncbi:L-type lectin-domain containing receptor kinase IX.1 [Beta vulgaris subsp. vulgaris]|uniref:L-type lectin-domain containing receptor kinase IX.1 n=1 Tax=Beta vulgaris subsp. vulgaris TaxID=3555 RepID=UPI00254730F9|nr:L-type lectin-domain containing receptor kinase IX.1 [Beta vulgaris subsp. vulgaris]
MSRSIHSLCSSLCSINYNPIIQITFVCLLLFVVHVESLFFNFTHFDLNNAQNISYQNDSMPANGVMQLTKNRADVGPQFSVGRTSYSQPVRLWDRNTNETTNFSTHFSFNITQMRRVAGDGFAFFLTAFDESTAYAPDYSAGGCLGLIGGHNHTCNITNKHPFVAVEFDTYNNWYDPGSFLRDAHLGIDVNSLNSTAYLPWSVVNGTAANVWITYDSSTMNLSVYFSYDVNPVFNGEYNLSHVINLTAILPEKIRVGFSAATGTDFEFHNILSWEFNSTLEDTEFSVLTRKSQSKHRVAIVGGVLGGIALLVIGLGFIVFLWWQRRARERSSDHEMNFDVDDDFDKETGPKRFTYNELSHATNNFSEEQKLGEGGFGGVYRGFLTDLDRYIAVKKISRESKQGKKEFMSEVRIISCLRHKNLVQLLGWCHERGDLLLVYECMPNGSLDSHLYRSKRKSVLQWTIRYNIAQGLASALLYLHEEWEQCVLHRDIKSSNVMLDIDFNAKLGDFGLARLVDHSTTSQTTLLAGTLGYLAPEVFNTGKASREADVYSFGVVTLEIACGRQPIDYKEEPTKVKMVEWVWNLYGEGRLLEAVDIELEGELDTQQIKCLMMVGLWCCHPDHTCRPSIRQAINVLNSESPLPTLPSKFPVPIYCSSPTNVDSFHISTSTSSSGITGSSSGTTNSSHQPVAPGTSPLLSENSDV